MPLDTKLLKQTAAKDKHFKKLLEILKKTGRNRKLTDIRQFRQFKLRELSYPETVTRFEVLQSARAGKLIVGKGNAPKRFQWLYPPKEVAMSLEHPAQSLSPSRSAKSAYRGETRRVIGKTVIVMELRGKPFKLELPADLSGAEANKIAEYIRQIPKG